MFFKSQFNSEGLINSETKIIFVSDLFVEDYVGGAELTTQALIDSCPFKYAKLRSSQVSIDLLQRGQHCHWIFGNFSGLNPQLIQVISQNIKYSILEYDYKYCRFRSPEKHENELGTPCNCHAQPFGNFIFRFFQGARSVWWMSMKQMEKYFKAFPLLCANTNNVLSSVFSKDTLTKISNLSLQNEIRKDWIVLGSESWVKGFASAKEWCKQNNKKYEIVWGISYDEMLYKFSRAEGFVYLPAGADTCPRMVIEAKLLGCDLVLNENVQHAKEAWFETSDLNSIMSYLLNRPKLFWDSLSRIVEGSLINGEFNV